MECSNIQTLFSFPELFTTIMRELDNATVVRIQSICTQFQKLTHQYVKTTIITASHQIHCIFNREGVQIALHDVAANILIIYDKKSLIFEDTICNNLGSIFNLTTGKQKHPLDPCGGGLNFFTFEPFHQFIIGHLEAGGIAAWRLDGSILYDYETYDTDFLKSCMYDNKKYLFHLMENAIHVQDIENQKTVQTFNLENEEKINKLFYNEKIDKFFTISWKKENDFYKEWIEFRDVATGKKTVSFQTPNQEGKGIESLNFLSYCNLIVTGDRSGNICFWDIEKGKLVKEIKLENSLAVSQITFGRKTNQIYVTQLNNPLPAGDADHGHSVTSRIDLL